MSIIDEERITHAMESDDEFPVNSDSDVMNGSEDGFKLVTSRKRHKRGSPNKDDSLNSSSRSSKQPQPQSQPQPKSKSKSQAKSDPKSDLKSDIKSDTKSNSKTDSKTNLKNNSNSKSKSTSSIRNWFDIIPNNPVLDKSRPLQGQPNQFTPSMVKGALLPGESTSI